MSPQLRPSSAARVSLLVFNTRPQARKRLHDTVTSTPRRAHYHSTLTGPSPPVRCDRRTAGLQGSGHSVSPVGSAWPSEVTKQSHFRVPLSGTIIAPYRISLVSRHRHPATTPPSAGGSQPPPLWTSCPQAVLVERECAVVGSSASVCISGLLLESMLVVGIGLEYVLLRCHTMDRTHAI